MFNVEHSCVKSFFWTSVYKLQARIAIVEVVVERCFSVESSGDTQSGLQKGDNAACFLWFRELRLYNVFRLHSPMVWSWF